MPMAGTNVVHTPEVHVFKKESVDMVPLPLTVFLTFRGGQYCRPSTGGQLKPDIARELFRVSVV